MKKIFKMAACFSFCAVLSIGTLFNAYADDASDLKDAKDELDSIKNELTGVMVQIDDLEISLAKSTKELKAANAELAAATEEQNRQYELMKKRIKYMYEKGNPDVFAEFLEKKDIKESLNVSEYASRLYEYDRNQLNVLENNTKRITGIKEKIEAEQKSYEESQTELLAKENSLNNRIDELSSKVDNLQTLVEAAAQDAANQGYDRNGDSYSGYLDQDEFHYVPSGDSSIGQSIVSYAENFLGIPYCSGGSSPDTGFDCSGFTSYVFANFGIGLSRSSGSQLYGGQAIDDLSDALPGDIICYPGHVAIYAGNGMVIHSPYPGRSVCYVDVTMSGSMYVIGIRRYW